MRNIKITLAYDGTDFHGWQEQPSEPTMPTIQGALMKAVEQITGAPTKVAGSGRTDAGVHALAQVASFRTESHIPCENLVKALNHNLPPVIRVLTAQEVDAGFHARFHAKAKTYRYHIYRGAVCPPHRWRYVHYFPYPLDADAMRRAALLFAGSHDFTSFASTQEVPEGSRLRTLFSSEMGEGEQELLYTARGSGFLHHMVRNIVGTLVEIGKGNRKAEEIPQMLEARDRTAAGPTAPAKGLWLVSVEY